MNCTVFAIYGNYINAVFLGFFHDYIACHNEGFFICKCNIYFIFNSGHCRFKTYFTRNRNKNNVI